MAQSSRGQVQTALGPVEAAGLGRVLMHEHVFVLTAEVQANYPSEWGDEDERVADAVRRLRELPSPASPPSSMSPSSARAGTSRGSSGSPSRSPS